MKIKDLLNKKEQGNTSPEHKDVHYDGEHSRLNSSSKGKTWSVTKDAVISERDTSSRGTALEIARKVWPATNSSEDQPIIIKDDASATTENLDQPQRASYTKEDLQGHINTFLKELKDTPTKKPADISSVQLWREKGNELRKEELDLIKEIATGLRESEQLDGILPGKNGNNVHSMIINSSRRSNPEKNQKEHESNKRWLTDNKDHHSAFQKHHYKKQKKS